MNIVCVGFLFLFSCEAPAPSPPVTVCPPVTAWSKEFQGRLVDEYQALPQEAAARLAIREAIQMRKRARACRAR